MTKAEAYQAMRNGNKIRHKNFTDNEFLYMINGVITSEEGYNFENWWNDTARWKENGWSIK